MRLGVIVGTNRPDSYSKKLAGEVMTACHALPFRSELIDLGTLSPEVYRASSYADDEAGKPAAFRPFLTAVRSAAGLIIVTPEYNGGFPGVLKLCLDLLPGRDNILSGKCVCLVGLAAGDWGGLRPVEQLTSILLYRKAFVFPERFLLRHCEDAFDSAGRIVDPMLRIRLSRMTMRFAGFVTQLAPIADTFSRGGENPAALEHPETF